MLWIMPREPTLKTIIRKSILFVVATCSMFFFSAVLQSQSIDLEEAKKLFEGSLEANDKHIEALENTKFDMTFTRIFNSRETSYDSSTVAFGQNYLAREKNSGDKHETLRLRNPEYTATLRKIEDSYSLQNLRKNEPKPANRRSAYGLYFGYSHITELIDSGKIDLKQVIRTEQGKLKFEFSVNESGDKYTGRMTVSPDRFWTIDSYESESEEHEHEKNIRYGKVVNGVPTPVFYEDKSKNFDIPLDHTIRELSFSELSLAPDDDIFWVSHYGIPEPDWVNKPRKSYPWLWLIIGAVVVSGAGFAIRKSARQSK